MLANTEFKKKRKRKTKRNKIRIEFIIITRQTTIILFFFFAIEMGCSASVQNQQDNGAMLPEDTVAPVKGGPDVTIRRIEASHYYNGNNSNNIIGDNKDAVSKSEAIEFRKGGEMQKEPGPQSGSLSSKGSDHSISSSNSNNAEVEKEDSPTITAIVSESAEAESKSRRSSSSININNNNNNNNNRQQKKESLGLTIDMSSHSSSPSIPMPSFFEWSSFVELGVVKVDNQHRILIDYLNELNDFVKNNNERWVIGHVLDGLLEYTQYHFKEEEGLMDKYGYPSEEGHKHIHEGFIDKVLDVRKRYIHCEDNIGQELLEFLKKWLVEHILQNDRSLCQYIRDRGDKEDLVENYCPHTDEDIRLFIKKTEENYRNKTYK